MRTSTAKDSIADAYLRLINNGKGDVSVSEIIQESGVSRQTFYYHFRGREDLLEYVMDRMIKAIGAKCLPNNPPEENIRITVGELCKRLDLMKTIDRGPGKEHHRQMLIDLVSKMIRRRAVTSTEFNSKLSVSEMDLLVTIHAYSFLGVFIEAIEKDTSVDPDTTAEMLYRIYSGKMPLLL